MKGAAVLFALVALAGCDSKAPQPEAAPTAASTGAPIVLPAPILAPSASRNPGEVLIRWAKAVSLRDWASARAYWGDNGAASRLTEQEFAARWDGLKHPDVELGSGEQEGAAGSSFYTAPVTIIDGQRRITGEVVLRRVNDVDGASAEQLRWHIESSTLTP